MPRSPPPPRPSLSPIREVPDGIWVAAPAHPSSPLLPPLQEMSDLSLGIGNTTKGEESVAVPAEEEGEEEENEEVPPALRDLEPPYFAVDWVTGDPLRPRLYWDGIDAITEKWLLAAQAIADLPPPPFATTAAQRTAFLSCRLQMQGVLTMAMAAGINVIEIGERPALD